MSKQCLDVQQMQYLQELGLELDYDTLYRYVKFEDTDWLLKPLSDLKIIGISFKYIPAYTLQDVLDALPKDISKDGCTWYASLYIDFENNRIAYGNTDRYGFEIYHEIMIEKDLIDAAYSMLCWCIENGFVKIGKEASDERADR